MVVGIRVVGVVDFGTVPWEGGVEDETVEDVLL